MRQRIRSQAPPCVIGVALVAMQIPGAIFPDPGINEAFAVNYGLASLGSLDGDYSDCDGSVSEDAHGERFGSNLRLVAAGRLYASEELGLGLERAVIFDQDERIVED